MPNTVLKPEALQDDIQETACWSRLEELRDTSQWLAQRSAQIISISRDLKSGSYARRTR